MHQLACKIVTTAMPRALWCQSRQATHLTQHPAGPPRRCRQVAAQARAGGGRGADDDVDVTVFRFTLGIAGFDDALIPRVVGVLGAALLLLNHIISDGLASDAQVGLLHTCCSMNCIQGC